MTGPATREVRFYPAIDTRGQPGGSLECMRLIFALKGAAGAITWAVLTQWVLPESHETSDAMSRLFSMPVVRGIEEHDATHALCRPVPVGIDVHRQPREGEESRECEFVASGKCVVDCGSLLHGGSVWRVFLQQGDAAVWRELEARYRDAFEVGASEGGANL